MGRDRGLNKGSQSYKRPAINYGEGGGGRYKMVGGGEDVRFHPYRQGKVLTILKGGGAQTVLVLF